MDDVWSKDERGLVFLFPVIVLTGEADLVGEQDSMATSSKIRRRSCGGAGNS
jgi:hypothetical protein